MNEQKIVRPHPNPSAAPWIAFALLAAGGTAAYVFMNRAKAEPKKDTKPQPPENAVKPEGTAVAGQYWNFDDEAEEPIVAVKRGVEYTTTTPDIQSSLDVVEFTSTPDGFVDVLWHQAGPGVQLAFKVNKPGRGTLDISKGDEFLRLNLFGT